MKTILTIDNLHIVTETDNPGYYLFNTCMMMDKDVLSGYEKVFSVSAQVDFFYRTQT